MRNTGHRVQANVGYRGSANIKLISQPNPYDILQAVMHNDISNTK